MTAAEETFDTLVAGYLTTVTDDGKTLLAYSLNLHRSWRGFFGRLGLQDGLKILDIGTGFGLLALDLARQYDVHVVASDINPDYIRHAESLLSHCNSMGLLSKGSSVRFEVADIASLPNGDQEFDLVCVREVFSYVEDPERAIAEIRRVLRPGGAVIIEDIDDHLYLTYPPASAAMRTLHEAVDSLQSKTGDRTVGRKLATYLDQGGFTIQWVDVPLEALYQTSAATEGERSFVIAQFARVRDRLVEEEVIDSGTFDRSLAELTEEPVHSEFRINGRVAVFATR
ncbi:MAG: methyltransferase domain-containing protein [Acidimicrobiales bacterium]